LTATSARLSRGASYCSRYFRAVSPAKEGSVTPWAYSIGWVSDAITSVDSAVVRWVIFSPPTRRVRSLAPLATDCHAW